MDSTKSIIGFFDNTAKIFAGSAAILVIVSTLIPPIGRYVNAATAWRFGATGVLKYEIGVVKKTGEIKPTPNVGDLYLLRGGDRNFGDLGFGDILQAKSTNYFREDNGCDNDDQKNCSKAPRVFELQKGQCAVVIKQLYKDSGPDTEYFKDKSGGWLRVASTRCGLFD